MPPCCHVICKERKKEIQLKICSVSYWFLANIQLNWERKKMCQPSLLLIKLRSITYKCERLQYDDAIQRVVRFFSTPVAHLKINEDHSTRGGGPPPALLRIKNANNRIITRRPTRIKLGILSVGAKTRIVSMARREYFCVSPPVVGWRVSKAPHLNLGLICGESELNPPGK